MKAYAALYEIYDSEIDDFRSAKPVDKFPGSAIENAPDLSLMAKARAGFHGPYGLESINFRGWVDRIHSEFCSLSMRRRRSRPGLLIWK